jgi:hypothetical protein
MYVSFFRKLLIEPYHKMVFVLEHFEDTEEFQKMVKLVLMIYFQVL